MRAGVLALLALVASAPGVVHAEPELIALGDEADALMGILPGEGAGAAVAVLDFNGDGWDDLAIAAPSSDRDGSDTGAVYLLWGGGSFPEGLTSLAEADVTLVDDQPGALLGAGMTTGDIDLDGLDDLVLSSPYGRSGGRVLVIRGRRSGLERARSTWTTWPT